MRFSVKEEKPMARKWQGQRKCMERKSDKGPGRAPGLTAGATAEGCGSSEEEKCEKEKKRGREGGCVYISKG